MSSASGNGAKWSGSAFIDAQQLLGDNKAELTAVVMHSAVEAALRKQDLIDVIQPSGQIRSVHIWVRELLLTTAVL